MKRRRELFRLIRRAIRWRDVDTLRDDWLPPWYWPEDSYPIAPEEPIFARPGPCAAGHRAVHVYDMAENGELIQWCGIHLTERIRRIWLTASVADRTKPARASEPRDYSADRG